MRVKERLEKISVVAKEKVVEDKEIEDDKGRSGYRNALERLECRWRKEFKPDPAIYQVNNIRFGLSAIGKKK